MSRSAGWTCPDLDQLALTIRRCCSEPELTESLLRIERVRLAAVLLRADASEPLSPRRAAKVAVEVAVIEDRILALEQRAEVSA